MTVRLVTVGETMALFRSSGIGSLADISEVRLGIGGAESNVAIGFARLGGKATWIGRVGADSLGDRVLRELRGQGLDLVVTVDADAPTGLMVKERRTSAVTRVSYYRTASAGSRLSPDDIQLADIQAGSVLHVTGITPALSDSAAEAVLKAIEFAHEASIPVSFDVNHRASLWRKRDAAAVYRRLASQSTIVFAGVEEAQLLVGARDSSVALAEAIAGLGPTQVIIKDGANGCSARIDGVEYSRAAFQIRAEDTVGAGDAFVAAYLAELLDGRPPAIRLDTATRAGAFACLGPGDWESLPRRDELHLLDSGDPVQR